MSKPKVQPSQDRKAEVLRCSESCAYFLDNYSLIMSEEEGAWVPFKLWPAQIKVLKALRDNRLVIALKARQLGMSWLMLGFVLWLVLFKPIATVLLFSRRDDEAMDLLANRLKGMHNRLPNWLQGGSCEPNNNHEWALPNGSRVKAFPTGTGDSYTASFVLVDEADLVPDLGRLMRAVKPTIDAGGRMVLLSRANKSKSAEDPKYPFKRIYMSAKRKLSDWFPIFIPWHARPGRDAAWYEAQKRDIFARTGGLDDLHEQYPATDVEALSARSLDKRIAPQWLEACYREQEPISPLPWGAPSIPGLEVFRKPVAQRSYLVCADPAEGNPTSDDSALEVIDLDTGEQVACLAGKYQCAVLAAHADAVGKWYNDALLMVERNNHGHAVLLWLADNSSLRVMDGLDGAKGWIESSKSKAMLYSLACDALRDGDAILHSFATYQQLASIEGATLKAPEGEHDDRAVAFALCLAVMLLMRRGGIWDSKPDPRSRSAIADMPF